MGRVGRLIASAWPIFGGNYAARIRNLFGSAIVGYWPLSDGPRSEKYITFDGSSTYIDCSGAAALDDLHSGEFTVDFWAYQDPSQQVTAVPVSKGSGTTGWNFYVLPQSSLAIFRVYDNTGAYVQGTGGYESGGWVHFTGYFDNTGDRKAFLALNGNWSEDSLALSNPIGSDEAIIFAIGRIASSASNWFDGKIGWVRVSSGDRFGAGTNFTPPSRDAVPAADGSTVALWGLNEGFGSLAGDLGPNNLDGTIYNGTWPAYPGAVDQSGNGYNGVYYGVNLVDTRAPGGGGAPFFDGLNDMVNISPAQSAISMDHGTVMGWIKVTDTDVWEDGIARNLLRLGNASGDYLYVRKYQTGSVFRIQRQADSVVHGGNVVCSGTDWIHIAGVWDVSSDILTVYANGVNAYNVTGNVAALTENPNVSLIGSASTTAVEIWLGWLSNVLILNRAATVDEINKVYEWGA